YQAAIPEGDRDDAMAFLFAPQPLNQEADAEHDLPSIAYATPDQVVGMLHGVEIQVTHVAHIYSSRISARPRWRCCSQRTPSRSCTLTSRRPKLVYLEAPVRRGLWFTGT